MRPKWPKLAGLTQKFLLPKDTLLRTYSHYYVSEYDHDIPQSYTADKLTAP